MKRRIPTLDEFIFEKNNLLDPSGKMGWYIKHPTGLNNAITNATSKNQMEKIPADKYELNDTSDKFYLFLVKGSTKHAYLVPREELDENTNEGGVKNAMFDMIEEIISIFSNAKPPVRIKKIATAIEDVCGYDPRNEKPEDFESALWQLDLPDLQEILTKIKAIK